MVKESSLKPNNNYTLTYSSIENLFSHIDFYNFGLATLKHTELLTDTN